MSDSTDDVFIAMKTSSQFYTSCVPPILDSWFPQAKHFTWFFSNKADENRSEKEQKRLESRTGGHLVITDCPSDHR